MGDYKINFKRLIAPLIVWITGIVVIVIYAPKTTYVNGMVGLGFGILCVSTIWALFLFCKEYDMTGKEWPFPLNKIFPRYPVVEDSSWYMQRLTNFRKSYSDFLSSPREEANSAFQSFTTQLMWHGIALQKRRLLKNGLTIEMDSRRRAYSGNDSCIREGRYFDGRYNVADIYEEISAVRTIRKKDRKLKQIIDKEVAHYTMLSARQQGSMNIICPNCGNSTTRENLLDGCDYCGTRFTVEDMQDKIDSFGLRRDIRTNASKKEALKELLLPWVTLLISLPMVYFGLVGAIVYGTDIGVFGSLITGLFLAALLGLLGWCFAWFSLFIIVPVLIPIVVSWKSVNKKLLFNQQQEEEREMQMSAYIRNTDPFFSMQSFLGGIQNKLSAIHYADYEAQINAFSENNMSAFVHQYKDVIDVDFLDLSMDSYKSDGWIQTAGVSAELRLLELKGSRIRSRKERIRMTLIKSAACKTQAVCGASVLRCRGCGASLSLMEGKRCAYCGRDLDLKMYDWVITNYMSNM